MTKKTISYNIFFNEIRTLCNFLFPIISFSYASRILGVEGIGKVNFVKTIISYFSMIAMLGTNCYGVREASKIRDDKIQLSIFSCEMLIINGVSTVVAYAMLTITVVFIPNFHTYLKLILINSFSILMSGLGMEWLYQAMEEYRYIAIRALKFQILSLCLMFLCVHTAEDIEWYMLITVFATSGAYIMNFINCHKFIKLRGSFNVQIKKHIRPIIKLFGLSVSIEIYTALDVTILGLLSGDSAVGLYSAANKINRLAISLIASAGFALVPRLSYYIGMCKEDKISKLLYKAHHFVFILSVPACLGIITLGDEIICMFSGKGYENAAFTLKILALTVLVIPYSMLVNQQIFLPLRKDNLMLLSTCVGAIVNLVLNLVLIPFYKQNGAAVATVVAEMSVAVICHYNYRKIRKGENFFQKYYQYWIAALPILILGQFCSFWNQNYIFKIIFMVIMSIFMYFGALIFMKNKFVLEIVKMIKSVLWRL